MVSCFQAGSGMYYLKWRSIQCGQDTHPILASSVPGTSAVLFGVEKRDDIQS